MATLPLGICHRHGAYGLAAAFPDFQGNFEIFIAETAHEIFDFGVT